MELAGTALDVLVEVLHGAGVRGPADIDLWTTVLTGLASQQVSNDPGGDRWLRLVDEAADRLLPATRPPRPATRRTTSRR